MLFFVEGWFSNWPGQEIATGLGNSLAQSPTQPQNAGMKTYVGIVLALAFCASAFATDPSKDAVAQPRVAKICYVKTIASGIPLPCVRYFGVVPTTGSPLTVIGRAPEGGGQVTATAALPTSN